MENKKNNPIEDLTDPVLKEGFSFLHLQDAVKKAALVRRRRRRYRRLGLLALALGGLMAGFWWFLRPETPDTVLPRALPPSAPSPLVSPPMAKTERPHTTALPRTAPAPVLRGGANVSTGATLPLSRLVFWPPRGLPLPAGLPDGVDSLLSAGAIEEAFPLIQRAQKRSSASDTLQWIKAWSLMRMGEGAAAQSEWQLVRSKHPEWSAAIDYYEALSLFLSGNTAQATAALSAIKQNKQHPFAQAATEALEEMRRKQ